MRRLEIKIYKKEEIGPDKWPQAKYFYSGLDDVGWTNDPEIIIKWIKKDLKELMGIFGKVNGKMVRLDNLTCNDCKLINCPYNGLNPNKRCKCYE